MDISDELHQARLVTSIRVLLAGLGVVVLWASAFPAIRVATIEFGAIGLSVARLVVAAVALLVIAPFFRVRLPKLRDFTLIIVCGFFGMTAYQLLLNWGELDVPAATASIIVAAAPLVSIGIAAVAFKERLSPVRMFGSAVAIGGVVLVCLARAGVSFSSAVWIVVGAMVVQGLYHPMTKPLLKKYSGLEVATYTMVAGALMTLPFIPLGWDAIASAGVASWSAALYLGLFPSALGFVLWGYAVARLPVITSTAFMYLIPPVAVLIAFVWLGEAPTPTELVGGGIVILGVMAISQGDRVAARMRTRVAVG